MNTNYNEQESEIALLKETIDNIKRTIEIEREEYKAMYQNNRKTNNNINPYIINSSNINFIQADDYTSFVDEEYYKENILINNLKIQITNLIKQNDILKNKNRELIEENERLKE